MVRRSPGRRTPILLLLQRCQPARAGNGLAIDYIWNFVDVGGMLPAQPTLPIPANAHWMPLAALVQVPFIWLFGADPALAALPIWMVGALAVPLTYLIAREAGLSRGGASCRAPGRGPRRADPILWPARQLRPVHDARRAGLWLCARGLRGDRRAFVLGGLVVGLATLARSDGILLGLPFALALARGVVGWRAGRARRIGWAAAVGCAALFAVVVAPWLYRQLEVFGSIAPSAANGRILWISDYSELYSIGAPATPADPARGRPGPVAGEPRRVAWSRPGPVCRPAAGCRPHPVRRPGRVDKPP